MTSHARSSPRKPTAELRVYWSKRERALVYDGSKPTGGMLAMFIEQITLGAAHGQAARPHDPDYQRTLAQELEARGYDLTTLRFQIRKKPAQGAASE